MSPIDRICSCCRRKWQKEDYQLCCLITAVALGSIALITIGFMAKGKHFTHLKANAMIGCGFTLPVMVICLFKWWEMFTNGRKKEEKPLAQKRVKGKPVLRKTQANQPYKAGRCGWIKNSRGEKVYFYRFKKAVEDPFYDQLHPGDRILVSIESGPEDLRLFVILVDEEGEYTRYGAHEIDDFQNIVHGELMQTKERLVEVLDALAGVTPKMSRSQLIARNFTIGIVFGASITAIAIGFIQFMGFYSFQGLNTSSAIALMSSGSVFALTIIILTRICHQRSEQIAPLSLRK